MQEIKIILVRGNITIAGNIAVRVAFKNWAPFTKCITKINGAKIDDAEYLVVPIYNLLEYGLNYPDTTGSLRFYSKDERYNFGNSIINTRAFKSFKYKCLQMKIKQKLRIKIRQISIDIFLNQTLWELTDSLFWFI